MVTASYHDRGQLFGTDGRSTWTDPGLFDGPTAADVESPRPCEHAAGIVSYTVRPGYRTAICSRCDALITGAVGASDWRTR